GRGGGAPHGASSPRRPVTGPAGPASRGGEPPGPRQRPKGGLEMQIGIALFITLVSACALNVGYLIEHSVAAKLPALSLRHPLRSVRSLLSSGRWLGGFSVEVIGWLLYVAALALAPLSLVQATAAGGIGLLAVLASRFTGVSVTTRD